ncbi:MAG: hemolysin family protein [Thermoanaerobaculia bacterium]
MALLIFYVALALGISFLCSVMEAVLLSVTAPFVAKLKQERPGVGAALEKLKQDIDRPLAAILSLNTIAHTVGAAGAGAQGAAVFGEAYLGVISGVLTLLILVLSEIIPKTLGAFYWRRLSGLVVRMLVPTMWAMWPLVKMAQGLTKLLTRGKKPQLVSREELAALARLGAHEGVVGHGESRILENLFRFDTVLAQDVMTPRTVIFALPETDTARETVTHHPEMRFSRIPVYQRNLDDAIGFVLKSDVLLAAAQGRGEIPLTELRRPLMAIPDDLPLSQLFEQLVNDRVHVALVVDEFGGTAGLVTMEDVVETLLGLEIVDEFDAVQDMRDLARQQWRQRAERLGLALDDG